MSQSEFLANFLAQHNKRSQIFQDRIRSQNGHSKLQQISTVVTRSITNGLD